MGWQDAPIVKPSAKKKAAWEDAPVIRKAEQAATPPEKPGLTLASAAFPGASREYQPREVAQPWTFNMQTGQPLMRQQGQTEQRAVAGMGDALSLPTRAAGTVGGLLGYDGATGGKQGYEALADSETGLMRPARQAYGNYFKSGLMGEAKSVPEMGFGYYDRNPGAIDERPVSRAERMAVGGVGYAAASLPEDPMAVIPGAGMAAKTKAAGRAFGAAERIANIPNKKLGALAEDLSKVSEEALRMGGTKAGRKTLEANAGQEYEIGQRLVAMLDNPKEYAPNAAKVNGALKGMGEVDIMPAVKALQEAKVRRPSGKLFSHERAANDEIQEVINDLLGTNGKTKISAEEVLDIRRALDDVTDHSGVSKNKLDITNGAKLKGRTALKGILEQKAKETGNPEYIDGMASLHKQLDARDRLTRFLGKNKDAQEDRAQSFIANMWGKNRQNRQKVLADIGDAFGKDFLEESKLANLAAQFGEEGRAGLVSRSTTGRSKWGGALTFPVSSPWVASRVTLPLAEQPPKVFRWLKSLSEAKSPQQAAFYAANLEKAGVTQEEVKAAVQLAPEALGPVAKPAASTGATQTAMGAERAFQRRIKAMAYLKETTGQEPAVGDVYRFLDDLGDSPVPVAPKKPKVEREFKGRRDDRHLGVQDQLLRAGMPDYPTKAVKASEAPNQFTLNEETYKKMGGYANFIRYKDSKGRIYEFPGKDDVIHMDYSPDEVPF